MTPSFAAPLQMLLLMAFMVAVTVGSPLHGQRRPSHVKTLGDNGGTVPSSATHASAAGHFAVLLKRWHQSAEAFAAERARRQTTIDQHLATGGPPMSDASIRGLVGIVDGAAHRDALLGAVRGLQVPAALGPIEAALSHFEDSLFVTFPNTGSTLSDVASTWGAASEVLAALTGTTVPEAAALAADKLRKYPHGRLHFAVHPESPLGPFATAVLWLPPKALRKAPLKRAMVRRGGLTFTGATQTPTVIAARYGIPPATGALYAKSSQAVAEFEGEQFYPADMKTFAAAYNLTFPVPVKVMGPNNGGYFDEGVLDIEYIQGIAPDAPTYWLAKDQFDLVGASELLLSIAPPARPTVFSISWGSGESGNDPATMQAGDHEFQKLGLAGVSVICASGDQGTGSTGIFSCGTFDATYPASSPYVTAVGATYSLDNTHPSAPDYEEKAWSLSGGGFSNVFAQPTYQSAAVAQYFVTQTGADANNTLPPSTYFNRTGRAVPDVATVGVNFNVCSSDYWGLATGTSAATPTFAAIITRLNHERAAQGKASIGFLNHILYKLKAVGFDVTVGSNPLAPCTAGFNAAVGWDPISGLGTPLYHALFEAIVVKAP